MHGLCIYLNEDPDDLVQEYMDMANINTLKAIEGTTVGIYVARGTSSSDYSDVGVILEGAVVLEDLESVALATAMLFALFYALNMRYPSKLRYTFEMATAIMDGINEDMKLRTNWSAHQLGKCFMPDALPDATLPFFRVWDRHCIQWLGVEALAGNRTQAFRMIGEKPTTEPPNKFLGGVIWGVSGALFSKLTAVGKKLFLWREVLVLMDRSLFPEGRDRKSSFPG
ncbi:hypothetical protein QTP86_012018 [Hemibagrus guttatus]|nr:hypothetical protein QTP86_012018 [Hemibagrus guttatus]